MRKLAIRTRGHAHGPITRLMSPGDLGQRLKPFVFLDLVNIPPGPASVMRWHPHSGIATVTVIKTGKVRYQETTGASGELPAGAIEWMASGKGVWHTGAPVGDENVRGFQLWLALPPDLEDLPPRSQYLHADSIAATGPARVILGDYDSVSSPIASPDGVTYLDVELRAGEMWTFKPPAKQTIAWLAVHQGQILCPEPAAFGDMLIFEEGDQSIPIGAKTDAGFVIGSAIRHPHDLHIGSHSVHTSAAALLKGEAEIERIRRTFG